MAADYDLVILGGTLAGRMAAVQAAGCGARVALVEPPGLFLLNQRHRYLLQVLQQVPKGQQAQAVSQWFKSRWSETASRGRTAWNWDAFLEWSAIATETQDAELSVAAMSAKGVDVVLEMPERLSQKNVVTTRSRQIKARAVLAAFGLSPDVFKPLTTATQIPKTVMVWGGEVRSLLWAEALSQIGAAVVLQTVEVLPGWDEGVQMLVRSQLTKAGVTFLDPADKRAINVKADCILPFGTEQPALTLPKFAYRQRESAPYLTVNQKLQAGSPRLFACGAIIEGNEDAIAPGQDVSIAIKNALFLPAYRINPDRKIKAGSRYAMVGLTYAQAKQRYGARVRVWEATQSNSTDLSQVTPSPSYCQLVCVDRLLVGVHLVGDRAADYISPLATSLGQPIAKLSNRVSPTTSPDLWNLVHAATSQYHQTQWKIGHWKRDWSENWFNWRRSRR